MIDCLTKMVYHKLIKITIDIANFIKVIINIMVRHHGFFESIIGDQSILFNSKFWFLLYCFLGIKQKLSRTFHLQIGGQSKERNNMIECYLHVFVNWEQNNQAKLLPMAKLQYNNGKYISISHMLFQLNCSYYPCVFFEDKVQPCSTFRSTNKLLKKLKELMLIC